MRKVQVLTTNTTHNSLAFNLPLKLHRKRLRSFGIDIELCFDWSQTQKDSDVLFVNSKFFRSGYNQDQVFGHLQSARQTTKSVLWFDTTDSTGATQFDVLPYVDGYYKNQILKDKTHYLQDFYGSRIFTDFYHRKYNIHDTDTSFQTIPPAKSDLCKIHVSWNAALGTYGPHAKLLTRLRKWFDIPYRYSVFFTRPDRTRNLAISCRMGTNHKRETIRYHRLQIAELLAHHFQVSTEPVSQSQYHRELQNAQLGISPFGWGEFAYRDYEIIIAGSALVKPDMSHVETWPDLYINAQTYVPFSWHLEDFAETLEDVLAKNQAQQIAAYAQEIYKKHLYDAEGYNAFCQRILNILNQHS